MQGVSLESDAWKKLQENLDLRAVIGQRPDSTGEISGEIGKREMMTNTCVYVSGEYVCEITSTKGGRRRVSAMAGEQHNTSAVCECSISKSLHYDDARLRLCQNNFNFPACTGGMQWQWLPIVESRFN